MNQWKWCVTDSNNKVVKGWFQDDDSNWYFLNDEGVMQTGWIQDKDGKWYYLYPQNTTNYSVNYPTGAMAVDWVKLGDKQKWYYLLKETTEYDGGTHYKGECVCNTTLVINGSKCTFDSNGVWQSGNSNLNSLISKEQVGFTGGFEGMDYHAVEDPYYPNDQRYWTIGHGTCYCAIPEAFPNGLNSTCTIEQADGWLAQEMSTVANTIKNALGDTYNSIPQRIFDVMCDIGYNAGTGDLIGGNTWKALISGDNQAIQIWLMKWCNANDQSSNGLYKRCKGRVNIALYGDYSTRP
jgi:lysozyme